MPLIWGEMGRGIFLLEGLDRANHVDAVTENRFSAHVGNLPDGQISGRTAGCASSTIANWSREYARNDQPSIECT
jgi:hypothetical protein